MILHQETFIKMRDIIDYIIAEYEKEFLIHNHDPTKAILDALYILKCEVDKVHNQYIDDQLTGPALL